MEDDNGMAAHPTLMLVLQDGFLCCLLLWWSKIKVPSSNHRVLPDWTRQRCFPQEGEEGRNLWGSAWAPSQRRGKGNQYAKKEWHD